MADIDMEGVLPVAPGVFSLTSEGEGGPMLLGGYCPECDRRYFPKRKRCPVCLEPIAEAPVGSRGTIYAYTVIRTKPPLGLPAPYAVGYVDLAESGLRVFGLFDPEEIPHLKIGLAVRLAVKPLGHDGRGQPRLRPYFTPNSEA